MSYHEPARRTTRRIPTLVVAGLLVVVPAFAASVSHPWWSSPSAPASASAPASVSAPPSAASEGAASMAATPTDVLPRGQHGEPGENGSAAPAGATVVPRERPRSLGEADGVVPDNVTVFDSEYPAVSRLDPALLGALRQAATSAAGDGIEVYVDSGWRSRAYQEQLFRQAVAKYGSAAQAARWVAVPGTSAHEAGDAVDLGRSAATEWLSAHGATYGLCQIYRNEPWHYELRPGAVDHGCSPMYADPTADPRMRL